MPNNEQLIKTAIGLGVGGVILIAVFLLVVLPMRKEAAEKREEIKETEEQLQTDRRLIEQRSEIIAEYNDIRKTFLTSLNEQLAPASGHGSPLSWTSNLLENLAAEAEVDIDNISRSGIARRGSGGDKNEEPAIEEFVVDLDLRAGYHAFGRFIANLEQRLPYARIEQLNIRPGRGGRDGRGQALNIKMRYGIFRFTEKALPEDKYPPPESPDIELEDTVAELTEDNEK